MKKKSLSLISALGFTLASVAQTTSVTPKVEAYNNGYMIVSVTPGGEFAAYTNRAEEATDGGRIVNIKTNEVTTVTSSQSTSSFGSISGVTADGKIAGGTFTSKPAYWSKDTQTWTTLPLSSSSHTGSIYAITPDGHYAVGEETLESEYNSAARLWDLTTNSIVELNNVPSKDLEGTSKNQVRFTNISSDGRYILGVISTSYPSYVNWFVYDRETETTSYVGFYLDSFGGKEIFYSLNETEDEAGKLTLHHVDYCVPSPNGRYVTGVATLASEDTSSSADDEYPFLYDVVNGTFTVYQGSDTDSGFKGCAVDDNGIVYAGNQDNAPLRDLYVRNGKYWYSFDNIFSQRYGIDILAKTGLDNTGTAMAITSDGRYIGTMVNPSDGSGINYTLYEDIAEACKSVDLMATYSFSPAAESRFSMLSEVTISFDRNIQVIAGKNESVQLLDSKGNELDTSMNITVSSNKATIQFFSTQLAENETYTIRIPAGTFAMANDAEVMNKEISVNYIGRKAGAVSALSVYPENNSQVSKFDYSSSHINIAFDANIALDNDDTKALVYRNNETEPYESFSLYVSGNTLVVYPSTTVYFFKDNTYRVVIPANAVSDLGGSTSTGNNEITLNYTGGYEREISADDKYLFNDDFSDGLTNFMLYEGDALEPSSEMADEQYNFTKTTTPWQYAAEDASSSDLCAMSHSSYATPGQSNDWMVTPAIYLPDETCYLQFKSQSYRKNSQDRLKVYVCPSEKNYTSITTDAYADLDANKILVYDELQSPGENEETLSGEWTDNFVDLAKYSGQQVYIAFVNDNYDQSIVFVDDVQVVHDMRFLVALDNETAVVAQDNIDIYGRVAVDAEGITYENAHLELYDTEGNLVDTIDDENLTINSKNAYSFRFAKPLPLEKGKEVTFTIKVKLGDDQYTVTRTISNVAFQTTKRVVLEEYAGATCGNCPLGMVAIEKLKKELPNNFLPISIRRYGSDPLSAGLDSYVSYLNFSGAPSAVIDRTYYNVAPMLGITTNNYVFNAPEDEDEDPLWCDVVYSLLETPAIADIELSATVNYDTNKIDSPVTIKYALDKSNVNASVFFVIVEDGLTSSQLNYFYNSTSKNLGDWAKGGIYGQKEVYDVPADDIARACIGDTFTGTQGFVGSSVVANVEYTTTMSYNIPSRVENLDNARVIAMLIDNNTDKVINANQCHITTSGVNDIVANGSAKISVDGNKVVVNSDAQSTVTVYNIAGSVVAQANGQGTVVANTNGYTGVAIVRVVSANETTVKKIVIK